METDNDSKTNVYKLTIFKCSTCGARAVPVDGSGEPCHMCDGTLDIETPAQQTYELTTEQADSFADSVIEPL